MSVHQLPHRETLDWTEIHAELSSGARLRIDHSRAAAEIVSAKGSVRPLSYRAALDLIGDHGHEMQKTAAVPGKHQEFWLGPAEDLRPVLQAGWHSFHELRSLGVSRHRLIYWRKQGQITTRQLGIHRLSPVDVWCDAAFAERLAKAGVHIRLVGSAGPPPPPAVDPVALAAKLQSLQEEYVRTLRRCAEARVLRSELAVHTAEILKALDDADQIARQSRRHMYGDGAHTRPPVLA